MMINTTERTTIFKFLKNGIVILFVWMGKKEKSSIGLSIIIDCFIVMKWSVGFYWIKFLALVMNNFWSYEVFFASCRVKSKHKDIVSIESTPRKISCF